MREVVVLLLIMVVVLVMVSVVSFSVGCCQIGNACYQDDTHPEEYQKCVTYGGTVKQNAKCRNNNCLYIQCIT